MALHQLGRAPLEARVAHPAVARRGTPADRLGLEQHHPRPQLGAPPRRREPRQPAPDHDQVRRVGQWTRGPVRLRRELRLPERTALEGAEWVGGRWHCLASVARRPASAASRRAPRPARPAIWPAAAGWDRPALSAPSPSVDDVATSRSLAASSACVSGATAGGLRMRVLVRLVVVRRRGRGARRGCRRLVRCDPGARPVGRVRDGPAGGPGRREARRRGLRRVREEARAGHTRHRTRTTPSPRSTRSPAATRSTS